MTAELRPDWTPTNAGARYVRADRRARVTIDTYQPTWTAETADGSRRRFYNLADAIQWADRWPDHGPTLDDAPTVRVAALELERRPA